MASLQFESTYSRAGFTASEISSRQNTPEPIIRELLQNSLDAALALQNPETPAEIVFTIASCHQSEIPGIKEYKQAFDSAKKFRSKQSQGDDEKRIIRYMEQVLADDQVRVLFCRDNGIGLNEKRLTNLLWPGNTDKDEGQAGAFGLGHLSAFQASDLHYVLYSGCYKDNGDITEIFSGRARLAAHSSKAGESRSENGYFVETLPQRTEDLPEYLSEAPALLKTQLSKISPGIGTGAVVCVLGFNDFNDDSKTKTANEILKAAAKNFFAAIHAAKMVIHIVDDTVGKSDILNSSNLPDLLAKFSGEKRPKKKGFLSGENAYRALETLQYGTEIEVADAKIFYRSLDEPGNRKHHEISLCRNGMWITREIPGCETSDFARTQPFNAVVLLEEKGGAMHSLIRKAEGPEHRDIDKSRLSQDEKNELTDLLQQVAEAIRKEVGEVQEQEEYRPRGFALIDHSEVRQASPRGRPRPSGSDKSKTSRGRTGDPGGVKPDKPKKPKRERPPRPGATLPIRSSIRPLEQDDGSVNQIKASCSFISQDITPDFVGVRIYQESGSDESCELPVNSEYLKLSGIAVEESPGTEIQYPPHKGGIEVVVPTHAKNLLISLADTHTRAATSAFKVELFPREKLKPQDDTEAEAEDEAQTQDNSQASTS